MRRVEQARRKEMVVQAEKLALAAHWCDLHGQVEFDKESRALPGQESLVELGGDGTPLVEEFAAAEYGAMAHQHPLAAKNFMADALDLRHRLPRTWDAIHALKLQAWVGQKIAQATHNLTREAAGHVDAAIAAHLESLPTGRLLQLVEAKIIEADPEFAEQQRKLTEEARFVRSTKDTNGLKTLIARATAGDVNIFEAMVSRIAEILAAQGDEDTADVRRSKAIGILARPAEALRLLLQGAADAGAEEEVTGDGTNESQQDKGKLLDLLTNLDPKTLRPHAKLFIHLTQDAIEGIRHRVGRVEGLGPVTVEQIRDWLGHHHVTVQPVLDIAGQEPVDAYEFPARLKEAIHQLHPTDVFPWSVSTSRRMDIDHTKAFKKPDEGGPPGQTGLHNAGPLNRHHHRIKTHGHWTMIQPRLGVFLWRTPMGSGSPSTTKAPDGSPPRKHC